MNNKQIFIPSTYTHIPSSDELISSKASGVSHDVAGGEYILEITDLMKNAFQKGKEMRETGHSLDTGDYDRFSNTPMGYYFFQIANKFIYDHNIIGYIYARKIEDGLAYCAVLGYNSVQYKYQ